MRWRTSPERAIEYGATSVGEVISVTMRSDRSFAAAMDSRACSNGADVARGPLGTLQP